MIEYYLDHYKGIIIYHYKFLIFLFFKNFHYSKKMREAYSFAFNYLINYRKLSKNIIEEFELGFAPNSWTSFSFSPALFEITKY